MKCRSNKWGVRSYKIDVNLRSPIADVKEKKLHSVKDNLLKPYFFAKRGELRIFPCFHSMYLYFSPYMYVCICLSICHSVLDYFSWIHRTSLNSLLYLLLTNNLNFALSNQRWLLKWINIHWSEVFSVFYSWNEFCYFWALE